MGRLEGFSAHGVSFAEKNDNQWVGTCPFCGREKKFHVHPTEHVCDCKVCGFAGNWSQFLERVAQEAIRKLQHRPALLERLAKDRGLPKSAFEGWVGYRDGTYLIPVRNFKGEVVDIRRYRVGGRWKGVRSTPGATTSILGAETIKDHTGTIFVCEGEWDYAALRWLIGNRKRYAVIAVPGAGTFKQSWAPAFRDKDVVFCYDHDAAGEKGMRRAANRVAQWARTVGCIRWPDVSTGYDVRDFVTRRKSKPKRAWKAFLDMIGEMPPTPGISPEQAPNQARQREELEPITWDECLEVFRRWLVLPDDDVLTFVFGTIFANKLGGDPLWSMLVGDSGGAKSVLIMSLRDSPLIYATSQITPAALISGVNWSDGADPSLLPMLHERILTVKDLTTILTMHSEDRGKLLGILRDAYDGQCGKDFGTGVRRNYENVRFGMLAGVTPAIDAYLAQEKGLGERFVKFRMRTYDPEMRERIVKRAIRNVGREDEMGAELREAAARCIARPAIEPEMDEDAVDVIWRLGDYAARLRGAILKDRYTKEVLSRPVQELPTRIARQFARFAQGVAALRGRQRVGRDELRLAAKLAHDTVPDRIGDIIRTLGLSADPMTRGAIARAVNLPRNTVGTIVQDLGLLGLLEGERQGKRTYYGLHDSFSYPADLLEGGRDEGQATTQAAKGAPRRGGGAAPAEAKRRLRARRRR